MANLNLVDNPESSLRSIYIISCKTYVCSVDDLVVDAR